VNWNITRLEGIHHVDLQAVGIVLNNVIRFHPANGPGATNDNAVGGVKGPESLVHSLLAMPQAVENVAERSHVQVLSNPIKSFQVVMESRHSSKRFLSRTVIRILILTFVVAFFVENVEFD
jgi:hypothetical protein